MGRHSPGWGEREVELQPKAALVRPGRSYCDSLRPKASMLRGHWGHRKSGKRADQCWRPRSSNREDAVLERRQFAPLLSLAAGLTGTSGPIHGFDLQTWLASPFQPLLCFEFCQVLSRDHLSTILIPNMNSAGGKRGHWPDGSIQVHPRQWSSVFQRWGECEKPWLL